MPKQRRTEKRQSRRTAERTQCTVLHSRVHLLSAPWPTSAVPQAVHAHLCVQVPDGTKEGAPVSRAGVKAGYHQAARWRYT